MDNWIMVAVWLSVVTLSDSVMSCRLNIIMCSPRVHGGTGSFMMLSILRMVGGLGVLFLVAVSLGVGVLSMSCLVMLVSLMDFGVLDSVVGVEGQGLVSVTMLNTVLGRCLDLVEELIVLMLDIVHHLSASVVAHIVFICVAWVVCMSSSVVSKIFITLVLVIIVITPPESTTFVVLWVLVVTAFMVIALMVFGAEVLVMIMFVMLRGGVLFTVIHGVLVFG